MTATKTELMKFGRQAAKGVGKLHHDLIEWEVFRRTFGWYQWSNKHGMTPEQVEHFRIGFETEVKSWSRP